MRTGRGWCPYDNIKECIKGGKMTRKDYETVGRVVAKITDEKVRDGILREFIRVFQLENERFREDKFYRFVEAEVKDAN